MAAEQLSKQAEIAKSGFRKEELCRQDFTGSIVLHAQGRESRAATILSEAVEDGLIEGNPASRLGKYTFGNAANATSTSSQ
jgi:hypothetical protein